MSFYCETVRQYRNGNGRLSDDSTISHFKCDAASCLSRKFADFDESVIPERWRAIRDSFNPKLIYHACSRSECYIEVIAMSQAGRQGRSTD